MHEPMYDVLTDHPLQSANSFGIAARSRYAVEIRDEADLPAVLADPRFAGLPRRLLGGGSNVVLTGDFDGLTLLMRIAGKRLVGESAEAVLVEAGAGEVWHELVAWTIAQDRPGLENLALIPGTAGAAPIQNIGAYGVELEERFDSLRAFDTKAGAFVTLDRDSCRFSYRDSLFKREPDRWIVTAVTLRLPRPWRPVTTYPDLARVFADRADVSAAEIFEAVIAVRRQKLPDPAVIGNAGSFFKNPIVPAAQYGDLAAAFPGLVGYPQPDGQVKLAAGWLIDRCGWKGRAVGRAAVHDRQALVLVNRGGATGAEILDLAREIQRSVRDTYGVALEPEPVIL
ncbi:MULTISPECIES: UDP-N-acetylmuramate dehydrogenase [Inquilinus]|uniref:UDP-N-acetylenolpyruvoylglucosamine reductase n=1 Tax=Inquilinus ginsengisoli TaxID=363840 RepID=A0ABU1JYX6_9PROT|nr:UDP-N-acetylmuramate dehydrogenase [Inquilinus ginsengisoli]MDR6293830.1 UDP-N-acetylmuramate dehydrogenase [Inquilinus ginsengisoli]